LFLGGLSQFRLWHRLSIGAILLLIFLKIISWAFNALRTRYLLRFMGQEIGWGEAATITVASEFAGVVTPGAMGMAVTYTFLFNRLGLRLGQAVGAVGLIMISDLALYGTIMPAAALIQLFQGSWSFQNLRLAGLSMVLVVGAGIFFWVLVRHHRAVFRFLSRQACRIPWLAQRRWRLGRTTVDFLRAVRFIGLMSWMQRFTLYLITFDFWLPRFMFLLLVIEMVHQKVPSGYLMLVQAVLNIIGQAFFLPGGGGIEDAGYAVLMAPFMGAEALAFTLLAWRISSFYWYLIVGGPIFVYKAGRAAWDLVTKKA
jgi:uncharacterized protein (TIRG00374 family)